jgi:5-methylcytosine-specific restriction protein A
MNAFVHEPRKTFTDQERARVFADAEGRCAACTRKLGPSDDWDIDHRIALENGGTNDPSNLQVLCEVCHEQKTGEDHGRAGKSRRTFTKHVVPRSKRRSKWNWRR